MIDKKYFFKIISETLKIDVSYLNMDLKINEIKNWDSLATINILVNLKKKKNIKISNNLDKFNSLKEFYDQINKID